MTNLLTFEQICIQPEIGFVYNDNSMVKISNPESYVDIIFKLTTKCDTSLLLLGSHKGPFDKFSIDLISLDCDDSNAGEAQGNWSSIKFWGGNSDSPSSSKRRKSDGDKSSLYLVSEAWEDLEKVGFHGMQVVAILGPDTMPNNGCRSLYSLGEFANNLIQSIETYYMFEKPNTTFVPNFSKSSKLNVQGDSDSYSRGFAVILSWKFKKDPRAEKNQSRSKSSSVLPGSILTAISKSKQKTPVGLNNYGLGQHDDSILPDRYNEYNDGNRTVTTSVTTETLPSPKSSNPNASTRTTTRTETLPNPKYPTPTPTRTTTRTETKTVTRKETRTPPKRRSMARGLEKSIIQDDGDTSDEEVSFKVAPKSRNIPSKVIPSPRYHPDLQTEEDTEEEEEPEPEPEPIIPDTTISGQCLNEVEMEDVTLGFEKRTGGRTGGRQKSFGRKSLMPQWSEEEKDSVLKFFDHLVPDITEQTRIALTCKFATIQYDRELPSKLLYPWIQKKNRNINKADHKVVLTEHEQREKVIDLYKLLNSDQSESSRVAFTIKYVKAQFDVKITSKMLYDWLSGKTKKTPKKR